MQMIFIKSQKRYLVVLIVCIWSKKIVEERASWLGCKKVKLTFNWEKDLDVSMILVRVIQDSDGSCQHAVTILCKWVFDSNEKVALPLCQEGLDCCTWEVKDGKVKKRKILDT